MSPSTYGRFFEARFEMKVVPEEQVIDDFILRDKVDLSVEYPQEELNRSDPIALVLGKDRSLFARHENVGSLLLQSRDNLIINPIYNVRSRGNEVTLHKTPLGERFAKLYPVTEKYLPPKCVLNKEIVRPGTTRAISKDLSEKNIRHVEYLMKRFIVLNVPKNYCALK
jgi:hypothetical protein